MPDRTSAESSGGPAANPFATVGVPVHGDGHVGRRDHVSALRERVLLQSTARATAIIGPPRIGKSSLVYHVFLRPEARQEHPRLLPVRMTVGNQESVARLFRRLAEEVWDLLRERSPHIEARTAEAGKRAMDPAAEWLEAQGDTQEFLTLVRRAGWRVVLILENFDAAREAFKSRPGTFQALRELADSLEWNIGLVTTSRRELREIVDMADPAESTFAGIFRPLFLTCMDGRELGELTARIPGAPVDGAFAGRLHELTGGHPYLASVLLDRLCRDGGRNTGLSDDTAPPPSLTPESLDGPVPLEFRYYYRDLVDLLRRDGRLRPLLETTLGPQLTVTPDDAQSLVQQGLVRVDGDVYRAFSDQFQQYLRLVHREPGRWDSWMRAETGVRDLIEAAFVDRYGVNWETAVRKDRPKLVTLLDKCDEKRQQELRTFGSRASSRLLDFTYPRDLYDLMAAHWDMFGKVLKKDKSYWNERFSLLAKVRNPMVHNRMSVVTPVEQRMFLLYCEEVLEMLGAAGIGSGGAASV